MRKGKTPSGSSDSESLAYPDSKLHEVIFTIRSITDARLGMYEASWKNTSMTEASWRELQENPAWVNRKKEVSGSITSIGMYTVTWVKGWYSTKDIESSVGGKEALRKFQRKGNKNRLRVAGMVQFTKR